MQSSPHHRGLFFSHHHSFRGFCSRAARAPPSLTIPAQPTGQCPVAIPREVPDAWGCPGALAALLLAGAVGHAASPCPAAPSWCCDTRNENSKTAQIHVYNAVLLPLWKTDSAIWCLKTVAQQHLLKGKLCFLTSVCSRLWCLSKRSSQTRLKDSSFA